MKRFALRGDNLLVLAGVLLLSLAVVACGGTADEEAAPRAEGPVLIMFYTDN